jgi:nitric oxide reductase subunit B
MREYRKLWWLLIAILIVTFSILGYFGREVYRQAPPIPGKVLSGRWFDLGLGIFA